MFVFINFAVSLLQLSAVICFIYNKAGEGKRKILFTGIIAGSICTAAVIFIRLCLKIVIFNVNPWADAVIGSLVYNGLIFETVKFMLFLKITEKSRIQTAEGILIYFLMNLCFFNSENILYAAGTAGIIRLIMYLPVCVFISFTAGKIIAEAVITNNKKMSLNGNIIALVYHGLYNFVLFSGNTETGIIWIVYMVFPLTLIYFVHFRQIYKGLEIKDFFKKGIL